MITWLILFILGLVRLPLSAYLQLKIHPIGMESRTAEVQHFIDFNNIICKNFKIKYVDVFHYPRGSYRFRQR